MDTNIVAIQANSSRKFSTLSGKVYHHLRQNILDGRLAPGTRLVRRKVSKQFGVSPVPVTEAIFRLERDGLVESEPMYGARVAVITEEQLRAEQILREALECQAARLCAERASRSQFEELARKAVEIDRRVHTGYEQGSKEGITLHTDFHLTIARFSGCALLEHELSRIGFRELMLVKWVSVTFKPGPKRWHAALVKALAKGNPTEAEEKMRAHVRYGSEYLHEALKQAQQGNL